MNILKKIVLPIFSAILFGFIIGRILFINYRDDIYSNFNSSKLYLVLNGEYDNIDNMREDNNGHNYVYYLDNNKYKSIVGITKKYDNVSKIESLYNDNLKVMEYYVGSDLLDTRQDEYDKELLHTNDINRVREVVDNILALYKSDDQIRLVSVN